MQTRHVADRLTAWAAGDLPDSEAARVREHLASCTSCAEEHDLLEQAHAVVPAIPRGEPHPAFAVRVAARASDLHVHPVGAPWWPWAFGGGLAAAAAATAVVFLIPRPPLPAEDLLVAQRLELFEDLSVVQNQDALRDIEVVAQLHRLAPEGKP
jgi:anti-sigma factor RsiW